MPSLETVSALERRLNASIPQHAIRGQVAARLKHIGRTAKIAGFRTGKIPGKILEQHFGMEARQKRWAKHCSVRLQKPFRPKS